MSQCYPAAREKFLTAALSWLVGDYRAVLLTAGYQPDFTDEFLSDISVNSRVATSEIMTNMSATDGKANADPIAFLLLNDTRSVGKAAIFKDTGAEATSPLVFFIDQDDLLSAPFIPTGLNYYIYPNAIEGGFFRL